MKEKKRDQGLGLEEREKELAYSDVIGCYSRKTTNSREIPFSCMVPQNVKNLLVASGKNVS